MQHASAHRFAGLHAVITTRPDQPFAGEEVYVIDWWDRLHRHSWMTCFKHPAVQAYAIRSQFRVFPLDDVVQVIAQGATFLFHDSELVEVVAK